MNCFIQGSEFVRGFFPARLCRPRRAAKWRRRSLSPQGVEFAKNFLGDELERAADRLVLAQVMRELREMTFQPRQFFGNIGAIGKERNFLQEPLVIDRRC